MNESTCIQVQTPVGLSQERSTGETVGQGTVEGVVVSAISLDNGVRDFFSGSETEVTFAGVSLGPILFQDDVTRLSLTTADDQAGKTKMECDAAPKLLELNVGKSCYIMIGKKKI